jgi:hypothetical protein
MALFDFMQNYVQWLEKAPAPGPFGFQAVLFQIAGNRNENNPFVLFGTGYFSANVVIGEDGHEGMKGRANLYFSDRISRRAQPFDATRIRKLYANLDIVREILQFVNIDSNITENQFSHFEERPNFQEPDSGLLVATSDFDKTIIVMSVRNNKFIPAPGPGDAGGTGWDPSPDHA